ncbi:MAG: hypothetical protein ACXVH3_38485 [Solirubrobacteraceae bacterium]
MTLVASARHVVGANARGHGSEQDMADVNFDEVGPVDMTGVTAGMTAATGTPAAGCCGDSCTPGRGLRDHQGQWAK